MNAYAPEPSRNPGRRVAVAAAVWALAAVSAGASGVYALGPAWVNAATIWSLVALILVCAGRWRPFHAWVFALDLRLLILFHATRFVGFAFLVLYQRGVLPYDFAVPGGFGDIAIAVTAIAVAWYYSMKAPYRRAVAFAWNTLGLLDILLVVSTALRLGLEDRASMAAITRWPLSLLPTYLVPLIIASHVIIYARLRSDRTLKARAV